MKHTRFSKLMSSLAVEIAASVRDSCDMIEMEPEGEIDSKDVLAVTNRLRERILFIERNAMLKSGE